MASDQQDGGLRRSLVIDRDTASRLGIAPQAIDDTLYDAFGQRQVSTIFTQLNQYRVVLEVAPRFQQDPEALKSIYVKSRLRRPGAAERVHAPATRARRRWPINHQGQFPRSRCRSTWRPASRSATPSAAIRGAERAIGLPPSIRASFQGTAQAFQASLANEPLLILAALITVYIVLGVLYESYIHPVTILSTLPSAGVGAILALLLCRSDLDIIALIGIILLIGIVKKNAIMMIDFALDAEREEGKPPAEAIYQACLLRFRPIMMTTHGGAARRPAAGARHAAPAPSCGARSASPSWAACSSPSSSRCTPRPSSTSPSTGSAGALRRSPAGRRGRRRARARAACRVTP